MSAPLTTPWLGRARPRPPLLTGLGLLVALSVAARPSALLTFALIALGGLLGTRRRRA